jgi:ribosome-associated protein
MRWNSATCARKGRAGRTSTRCPAPFTCASTSRASLPAAVKHRLLALQDQRVTREGVIVIKAQTSRSRTHNRAEALARLQALIDEAARVQPVRRATRPTLASQRRRLQGKALRSRIKASRGRGGDVE